MSSPEANLSDSTATALRLLGDVLFMAARYAEGRQTGVDRDVRAVYRAAREIDPTFRPIGNEDDLALMGGINVTP